MKDPPPIGMNLGITLMKVDTKMKIIKLVITGKGKNKWIRAIYPKSKNSALESRSVHISFYEDTTRFIKFVNSLLKSQTKLIN